MNRLNTRDVARQHVVGEQERGEKLEKSTSAAHLNLGPEIFWELAFVPLLTQKPFSCLLMTESL